jgi:competence ComEA-like helix-hairpin-helix protein
MRPIDLNAADMGELQTIGGIDKERAKSLIRYRNEHGQLHRWEDLENVPGFDFEAIGQVREQGAVLLEVAEQRRTG